MGPGIPISAPAESAPDDPSLGETPNKTCNNNQLQENSLQPVQGWSGNRPTASHRPAPMPGIRLPRRLRSPEPDPRRPRRSKGETKGKVCLVDPPVYGKTHEIHVPGQRNPRSGLILLPNLQAVGYKKGVVG